MPDPPARSLRYGMVNENEKLLAAVSVMWETEAELILVSRHPEFRRAEDLVGVVTRATLSRVFKTDEDLS